MSVGKIDSIVFLNSLSESEWKLHTIIPKYSGSSTIQEIYNAYVALFGGTKIGESETIAGTNEIFQKNLLEQFNKILSLIGNPRSYTVPLNLKEIFNENELTVARNTCLEGNKAYQYYLREIIGQFDALYQAIAQAKIVLKTLLDLINIGKVDFATTHAKLDRLEILAKQAGEVIKNFSKFSVVKNLAVKTYEIYKLDGQTKIDERGEYDCIAPEIEYEDFSKKFKSVIDENQIKSVADLRSLQTKKFFYDRSITARYYAINEKSEVEVADKYDLNARVDISLKDVSQKNPDGTEKEEISTIALFDELTLLDKLKYIVLYYTKPGVEQRHIFPQDAKKGFPCLPNTLSEQSDKYTNDVNEIANLELFYVGFLLNRDGAANALAVFMEIKSSAVSSQIKLLSYRIKALKHYLNLLNRGYQAFHASQSNGKASIAQSAYCVLAYVGSNILRTLITVKDWKDVQGDTFSGEFFVLQYRNYTGKIDKEKGDAEHVTEKKQYLFVEASEAGIEAFVNNAYYCKAEGMNYSSYDAIFKNVDIGGRRLIEPKVPTDYMRIVKMVNEADLPRELDVQHANTTTAFSNFSGYHWYDTPPKEDTAKIWEALVSAWDNTYKTVIENIQTNLNFTQKSVEALRQKINTFDASATNFRNKAYSVYNKTVRNIS